MSSAMFHANARDFLDGLHAIHGARAESRPHHIDVLAASESVLASLAAESALKGLLRGAGWCMNHLKARGKRLGNPEAKIGHNLLRAYDICIERGLLEGCADAEIERAIVDWMSDRWQSRYWPYIEQGADRGPPAALVIGAVDRIVTVSHEHCVRQERVHEESAPTLPISREANERGGCGCPLPDPWPAE